MSLKDLWRLLKKPSNVNYSFTKEDNEHSQDIKRIKHETERLRVEADRTRIEADKRRAEVELKKYDDLLNDYDDEEDEGEMDEGGDIQTTLSAIPAILGMMKGNGQTIPPPIVNFSPSPIPQLSDDEIRNFIKQQDKKKIKFAKTLPKEILKQQAINNFHIDERSAERAYEIMQREF